MCVTVQSQDRFDEVVKLNSPDGVLEVLSKRAHAEELPARPCGLFSNLGGQFVALFQQEGVLWLRVGVLAYRIEDDFTAEWHELPDLNSLTIKRRDASVVTIRYKPPVINPPLESDPTPFVEREQFDFGLFVHNVLNDPKLLPI
jgi:hypothetical protein